MEQWLPRQPLILTPTIPLMWTVGWLCTMSAYIILGGEPPSPNQLQDSVLLVSAVILVMNMYNLILIYQRAEKYRNLSPYAPRALLLAIVLIISIVLAWGQPKVVLIPKELNSLPIISPAILALLTSPVAPNAMFPGKAVPDPKR